MELTWQYLDLLRIYTKPKVPLFFIGNRHVLCAVQHNLGGCPPAAAPHCICEPSLLVVLFKQRPRHS